MVGVEGIESVEFGARLPRYGLPGFPVFGQEIELLTERKDGLAIEVPLCRWVSELIRITDG